MASNESEETRSTAHVLYELLVYKEWKLDVEKHKNVSKYDLLAAKAPKSWWLRTVWSMFTRIPWPEDDLAKASSLLLPWQISVSPDGKLVAILEDSVLEIRQSKDEYSTIVGRAAVPKDKRPQFRKTSWSPDNTMIAVSSSDSSVRIYDCFGSLIFKIPLIPPENTSRKLIVGLEFIKAREKKGEMELLIIYSCGSLECYNISSIDKCVLVYHTVLSENGISCTYFSHQYNILFAAVKPLNISFESSKFFAGGTAWRLLNEPPYYKRVYPTDDQLSILEIHSKMRWLFSFFTSSDCICKISMSPSSQFLAALYTRGVVVLFHAPGLRFHSVLDRLDSKKQKVLVPLSEMRISSHIIDIEWRKDNKLIVGWKNGTVSIHDINTSVVLTYFGPEFLNGLPRLASASSLHGFLTLECETVNLPMSSLTPTADTSRLLDNEDFSLNESRIKPEDSGSDDEKSLVDSTAELIYNTIYLITDIEKYEPRRKSVKFVQRIYRLLGVKMTTPEELFERYLKSEDFERAFEICQEYGLDVMKVYMRQWRTSEVNDFSIHQYLANVGDQDWIITECLERVPESLSGARSLIKFGLEYTDIRPILEEEKRTAEQVELTEEQKRIIVARLKLLDYADKLKIYEQIIDEDSYDPKQYNKFRNQSIVSSAVDFARSAQTAAIVLLMTDHGSEVLPFWLNILDNYPETLRPSAYSSILPECDGDNVPVRWMCSDSNGEEDWARTEYACEFSHMITSNPPHKFDELYSFDSETLSKWYKKRALSLEKYSTIVDNAVELLQLGIARNIKGLEEILFEFQMLGSLVYELNSNLTYTLFHNETIPKKLQLFVQAPDDFCTIMTKWIHPYLEHFADKNSSEWYDLYKDFMVTNSKTIFGSMIPYFDHLLNGNLHLVGTPEILIKTLLECVYSYDQLDKLKETNDLINDTVRWFRALSEENRSTDLLKSLIDARNEVNAAHVLMRNDFKRPISVIHGIKSDPAQCKAFISEFTASVLKTFESDVEQWEDFLLDLVNLQKYCFVKIPEEFVFKVFVTHLLKSGNPELIEYSPNLLCCSKSMPVKNLSFESSVKIVVEAAQYYFNSSSNYSDRFMQMAKTCLLLIKEDHELVQEELDLIFAVRLLSELGVTILPLQVRQTEDKMKLIDMCFDRNSRAYSNPHMIYKLSSKLRLRGRSNITLRLAQESFRRQDYKLCAEFCEDLVLDQYSDGWKVCMSLAECETLKDTSVKIKLINFATIHAPARMLPQIIKTRNFLQNELLVSNIRKMLKTHFSSLSLPQNLEQKLNALQESHSTQDMLNFFYELWGTGCIQNLIKEKLKKEFIIVQPRMYHSNQKSRKVAEKSKTTDSFVEIMNCFLKLLTTAADYDEKVFSEVLMACSLLSSSEDTALSLCFLLNLKDANEIQKFFDCFEESTTLFQFVFYFLSLKSSSFSNDFSQSPLEVVSSFLRNNEDEELSSLFKRFVHDYKNFKEASQITSLEFGIDSNRFKQDENYKSDTIFGLALNEQYENLKLAMDLARKNRIPVHEVVLSHIISLLLNSSNASLNQRLEDKELIKELAQNREGSISRFMDTLPSLNGCNHQQLIYFFSFIKALKDDYIVWGLSPKEHISLLKKVKSLSKSVDYRSLVLSEKELSVTLKPLMEEDNVNVIGKLFKSLPSSIKSKYDTSKFFSQWAVDIYNKKCLHSTFKQCVQGFESLYKFFQKMSPEDLILFTKSTVLSELSMTSMESGIRKHLLVLLTDWCQGSAEYSSVIDFLQNNLAMLERLWDEDLENFGENLSKHIYSIEEALKDNNSIDLNSLFNSFVLDLSLTQDELVYLHKISKIEQPLLSVINSLQSTSPEHSKAAIEWKKRLCWSKDEEFSYHEVLISKPEFQTEDKIVDFYLDELKKYYLDDVEPDVFNVDFSDAQTSEEFFKRLTESSYEFEQLVVLHRFVVDLPSSFQFDRQQVEIRILKALMSVSAGDQMEYKYSLAKDILTRTTVDKDVCNDLLKSSESSKNDKHFAYWLCLHSDFPEIKEAVRRRLETEEDFDKFADLPKAVVTKIVPHIVPTKSYQKLVTFLVQAENEDLLKYCIEGLREATLVAEAQSLKLLTNHTPRGLRSFHTALNM